MSHRCVYKIGVRSDYYGNTCLHYAASSSSQDCYEFFKKLDPAWENQKNIFGHLSRDYLPENINNLPRLEQNHLIDKLNIYMETESPGKNNKEKLKGLCYGIAPITALHILRGKSTLQDYYEMQRIILAWDGTKEGLQNNIDNPNLNKLGLKSTNDVFRYLEVTPMSRPVPKKFLGYSNPFYH